MENDSIELWKSSEGQLAVDVIETPTEIIIRSAIAGVRPQDIDVHVTSDLVTIRGTRERHKERHDATVHFEECFWGSFSRSIVLPSHVKPDEANAQMKNGVLTLTIPKAHGEIRVPISDDLSD
ncbi:Hsp20/alpha crystallin family protein [Candidatus Parcubacteria bacterium]|nr:Hsp20/alpha crystallin family protein [Patescibacteria group bacterium]MCG2687667.1 Hsp20/alpha crystallin family protein [Candidatus Parcubacteria bacterium]